MWSANQPPLRVGDDRVHGVIRAVEARGAKVAARIAGLEGDDDQPLRTRPGQRAAAPAEVEPASTIPSVPRAMSAATRVRRPAAPTGNHGNQGHPGVAASEASRFP